MAKSVQKKAWISKMKGKKMNTNVMAVMLAFVLLCTLFVGCGRITSGEVYSKDYHPAYSKEVYRPIKIGDTTIPNWETKHYPERWSIDIRKMDEETNEWKTRRVYVPKTTYDRLEIGDWYDVP
jgi:hypothetical protein